MLLKIGKFFSLGLLLLLSVTAQAEPINAIFHGKGDPIAGNASGKITVVEFFDYQCGYCVMMAPAISGIIKSNPDLRVVYKELPIRGPMSVYAARAALAANKQGKYIPFHHALMNANEALTEKKIMELATSAGLNISKLKKDMNDKNVINTLNATMKLADELKLTGTPAIFIGKTNATNSEEIAFIPGAMDQSELQSAIDKIRK